MSHDHVPIGPRAPQEVRTIIEVPKGSSNKYRFNAATGSFRYERTLYSPLFYPYDYGWICGTKSPAYDRGINCLVIAKNPTFPGCMVEARPIATLRMSDDKGFDPKILCVALRDPRLEDVRSLADITEYILTEIHNFFEVYQTLERREVTIDGWADTEETYSLLLSAMSTATDPPARHKKGSH